MMLNDTVVSLIRTWTPVIVGGAISWAARKLGLVEIDTAAVGTTFTALVMGAYYAAGRLLEKRWPIFGWLLGVPSEPSYAGTPPAGPAPSELG